MVTNWDNHWDNLPNNTTYYTFGMLKEGMEKGKIREYTPTIFIKLNKKSKRVEKTWEGEVYDFQINDKEKRIYFKVKIKREIDCPLKYQNYREGWYIDEEYEEGMLWPPFFYCLKITTNWQDFENYTYWLLKLLGIHNIYRYEKQRGRPDGFFKFKNLLVIYDCTLEKDFEKKKQTQIENYCSQLKKEVIRYQKKEISIYGCHKRVWIITRGLLPCTIKKVDDILVREIPIGELFRVYLERLQNNLDEVDLERKLMEL